MERKKSFWEEHGRSIVHALVALVVLGSMLAVGTVHPPWVLGFSCLALLTGCLTLWRQGARLTDIPAPAHLFVALGAYSVLQAVPLPFGWLTAIAPHNADVWAQTYTLVTGAAPRFASVSVDPSASLVEGLKWLAYAALFVGAAALGRRQGATVGARIVFASALLAALITLGHASTGATALYGVYDPLQARPPWALAPLLNPNNLAGYLNLGFFCGLGLLVAVESSGPRWLLALAAAVVAAVSIMSGSRAGALALGLGCVALAFALLIVFWRNRRRVQETAAVVAQVGAAIFGAGVLFVLGATDVVWRQLLDETATKLEILGWTRPLIADHLWWGVGRGAYETAFPPYRGGERSVVFQFAENFVVQWVAEWGIVVGLATVFALVFLFRPGRMRAFESPVAAASMVGLLALLVQNLLDLGLELPSVGFAVAVVLGGLWGGAQRSARRGARREEPEDDELDGWHVAEQRLTWLGLAVPSLVLALAVGRWGMHPIVTERHRLQEEVATAAAAGPGALEGAARDLHASLLAHPGDPYLPILGALVAQARGENPLPWVGRAIERDPSAGRPHLLLAQLLAGRKLKSQALLAARTAVERDEGLVPAGARLIARLTATHDEILALAPRTERGTVLLLAVAKELPLGGTPRDQLRLLALTIERDPAAAAPREALVRALLGAARQRPPVGPCATDFVRCLATIDEEIAALDRVTVEPKDRADLPLLRAQVLLLRGHAQTAEDLLRETCREQPTSVPCWTLRLEAAHTANRPEALSQAEDGLFAAACGNRGRCITAARTAARTRQARQEWLAAAAHYERAARDSGAGNDWLLAAEMAIRAGHARQAEHAVKQARLAGQAPSPALEAKIERAKRSVLLHGIAPD